jgi:hypothetical protein
MARARTDRTHLSIRMRPQILEALDETAEELVVSRSRLIEAAVESFLARLELPPTARPVDDPALTVARAICGASRRINDSGARTPG